MSATGQITTAHTAISILLIFISMLLLFLPSISTKAPVSPNAPLLCMQIPLNCQINASIAFLHASTVSLRKFASPVLKIICTIPLIESAMQLAQSRLLLLLETSVWTAQKSAQLVLSLLLIVLAVLLRQRYMRVPVYLTVLVSSSFSTNSVLSAMRNAGLAQRLPPTALLASQTTQQFFSTTTKSKTNVWRAVQTSITLTHSSSVSHVLTKAEAAETAHPQLNVYLVMLGTSS